MRAAWYPAGAWESADVHGATTGFRARPRRPTDRTVDVERPGHVGRTRLAPRQRHSPMWSTLPRRRLPLSAYLCQTTRTTL